MMYSFARVFFHVLRSPRRRRLFFLFRRLLQRPLVARRRFRLKPFPLRQPLAPGPVKVPPERLPHPQREDHPRCLLNPT